MTELSKPMKRLAEFNQFVTAELNPEGFRGPSSQGLLNVLNGCFVRPVTITEQQGVFKIKTTLDDEAVYLVWLEPSYDNNAHAVRLSGESLAKFERAMRAQSKSLDC